MNKLIDRLTWYPLSCLQSFVENDNKWADARLLATLALVTLFAVGGRLAWEIIDMSRKLDWLLNIPQFGEVDSRLPIPAIEFIASFLVPQALRYWLPPSFGALLAFLAGALYFQDIFNLSELLDQACRYLLYSLFGLPKYPTLIIRDGKIEPGKRGSHLINTIGGPGYVDIKLGNAVLFERAAGASSVHGAGKHFIRRFECVREIVDLEMQHRTGDADTETKDGIHIIIRDIEVTFRLRADPRTPRTAINPYPFATKAIYTIAYDKSVNVEGAISNWQGSVFGAVKGRIAGWVSSNTLDALTAPLDEDPRQQIQDIFKRKDVHKQFFNIGVELLWISAGHIDTPREVDDRRLATWRVHWQTHNLITQARAEATEITYKSLARAEAQAETLTAIMQALREAAANNEHGEQQTRLGDLIIVYMAQILESMTATPGLAESDRTELLPPRENMNVE